MEMHNWKTLSVSSGVGISTHSLHAIYTVSQKSSHLLTLCNFVKVVQQHPQGEVGSVIRFTKCKNFENRLRFDKVTKSFKVGTFLRHSVVTVIFY